MAAITPQMVKELRDKTDAGMGECKKALIEANGDIEAAVDIFLSCLQKSIIFRRCIQKRIVAFIVLCIFIYQFLCILIVIVKCYRESGFLMRKYWYQLIGILRTFHQYTIGLVCFYDSQKMVRTNRTVMSYRKIQYFL